jgi:hypothetical protein
MEKKSIYLLWAIVCRVVELDGYTAGRVLHINGDMFWAVSDSCVVFPAVHQTKPIACRRARHSGYSGGGEIFPFCLYLFWLGDYIPASPGFSYCSSRLLIGHLFFLTLIISFGPFVCCGCWRLYLVLSPLGNSDESFDADPGVSEWFGVVKRG